MNALNALVGSVGHPRRIEFHEGVAARRRNDRKEYLADPGQGA